MCFCLGHTIVCATNEGLFARVGLCSNRGHCSFTSSNGKCFSVDLSSPNYLNELISVAKSWDFFSYVAGSILAMLEYAESLQLSTIKESGIAINNYKTTLPMGKGLSSSAAVCVLVVKSFSDYFLLNLSTEEVKQMYDSEI